MTNVDNCANILVESVPSRKLWYDEFVEKLLSENFLLTALEFHSELTEAGKEIPKLKDFFSNPSNFEHLATAKPEFLISVNLPRSSSQATLDSLDLTRYSEDGERCSDDRVAVLEFELRKARETINALRANLTEAAESETKKFRPEEENIKEVSTAQKNQYFSIKPHEQRALNFLINEYLLMNGYKLTSITFADENESQDFEDWNDVGLNSARPLELLYLYREALKATGYLHSLKKDFECQVTLCNEMQQVIHINKLEKEIEDLNNKIVAMNLDFSKKLNSFEHHRAVEADSHGSLTPDPECFEMVENMKSHEESETKSDKSNGDWTNIEDKIKKESFDIKSDSQSVFESFSNEDKLESCSVVFDSFEESKNDAMDIDNKSKEFYEVGNECSVKPMENLNEKISDDIYDNTYENHLISNSNCINKKENMESSNVVRIRREVPDDFKREILKFYDINAPQINIGDILLTWFQGTTLKDMTACHLVEILSNSLQKIIPNIILNKREEIIPLLVLSICINKDFSKRDKLLHLLFNLKKRPQVEEQYMILEALLVIAYIKGPETVENEILPQCWEQITHKYVERRMLVAQSCFVLAPYVSETIRNSLILSIAQQLLEDKEASVRVASLNIFTLLITLMSDEDKYSQVLEICFKIINDESPEVVNSLNQLLFPSLAQWSLQLNKIQSDLYSKLLLKVKKEKNSNVINLIEILLPYLIVAVAHSAQFLQPCNNQFSNSANRQEFSNLYKGLNNPDIFFKGSVKELMGNFDSYSSKLEFDNHMWPELEWIMNVFIPTFLEVGDDSWEDCKILRALVITLRYLCLGLGRNVTDHVIKPFLMKKLVDCENSVVSGEDCKYCIIPLYLVGVLSTNPEELQEMSNTLRRFICALPLCGVSLIPLQITVEILSQFQPWQIVVLDAIWEGVVHQRASVRSGSALLLECIITYIPESLLSTKIMPALVTLTSDPETTVRISAIPALGMLVYSTEKAMKDKVYLTFQNLLQDSINLENHSLIIQLVKTIAPMYEVGDNKFREEVIVKQLSAIAALASRTKSKELAEVLSDAFLVVTFSQTQVSSQCVPSLLLGLRYLESLCIQLNLPYSEHVDSMIKDVERRLTTKENQKKSVTSSPLEAKRFTNAVSSHVVVEDVRNRVTKMFNTRPNSFQNVSGIFKKKT